MTSRCPRCDSPIAGEWAVCPTCGLSRPSSWGYIKCRKCGARARRIYFVCPGCGADLKPAPFPLWPIPVGRYLQFAGGALLVMGIAWGAVRVRPDIERGASQVLTFFMPTPTLTPTATGTATPTPTPTSTPTCTATPTSTSTVASTPTATPSETVTPTRLALPATATPTATPTPTPTPRFLAPVLLGPPDGEIFVGREQFVVLSWKPVGLLAPDEWYAVRILWSEDGVSAQRGGTNLKETSWQVPADFYWGKADQETGRAYEWYVYIEKVAQSQEGQRVGEAVSAPSETRVLYWQ